MQLKSILNRLQKHSAFVYETVRLVEHPRLTLEVRVRPRRGTRATCSQCRRPAPGYDTRPPRRFDFVPLWHIPVVLVYAMRRVSCPRCGVKVEAIPWATGKHRVTDAYAWFLAGWAQRLSWQEVAAAFPTSWDTVYRAVRMAVEWGLAHRDLTNIEAIGVDELSRRRGQRYLTLVYQIDSHRKRLLWVGRDRRAETLQGFFDWLGPARSAALYFVCSDMWKPYLKVVAERAKQAVHVLDRFHIMSHPIWTPSRVARSNWVCLERQVAVLYPACSCRTCALLAPMESADPRLILLTGLLAPVAHSGLTGRDLTCVPSHLVVPCATSFGEPARVVKGRTSSFRP